MTSRLQGKIAVVTGASRGAGSAIAHELGLAGATVYITGRSTRDTGSTENLSGTIEEVAAEVSECGGAGIAVRCDHTVDREVEALFDRVREEHGRLDLLVNNVWGGYEHYEHAEFSAPFWEQPLRHWDGMFTAGLRAHFVASRLAASIMLPQPQGLIINTVAWAFGAYLGNLFYDVAKAAIVRMAFGMAQELREHNITAVALAPGFMRTERVMAAHAKQPFDLRQTESPTYLGRAVVALAGDSHVMRKSGELLTVGELAKEYGFSDVDETQPPPFRMPDDV
jgi:NAD(P)-dependent dehydrogenase (short-subunit alcohol dehydrogenase family)